MEKTCSYIAFGDSYTIGEGVPIYDSFPYQTVQILRKSGHSFYGPEIVAKTGWTTDELLTGIEQITLEKHYHFATLLIGVNDQYRGRSVDDYTLKFKQVLRKAWQVAPKMIVLSIPDWGATPFAADRDRKKITEEIDGFNNVNREIATRYGAYYIDITPSTRNPNDTLLAADKLHPSGKEYYKWAQEVATIINKLL
ncbi:MAG TPA: SGNH/GDSL hydrolase family protein [Chitinophagaceae bacterium]|nr:SGNH/GDSL hydrolase family protein [Chitinophagaceae bacterium]